MRSGPAGQRTRETGRALAEGIFPGCNVQVRARAEGMKDPLFHAMDEGVTAPDRALAAAAIAGRIGGDPNNLTEAYRPQLETLDRILAGCGKASPENKDRTSILRLHPAPAIIWPRCADQSRLLPHFPRICFSSTQKG